MWDDDGIPYSEEWWRSFPLDIRTRLVQEGHTSYAVPLPPHENRAGGGRETMFEPAAWQSMVASLNDMSDTLDDAGEIQAGGLEFIPPVEDPSACTPGGHLLYNAVQALPRFFPALYRAYQMDGLH